MILLGKSHKHLKAFWQKPQQVCIPRTGTPEGKGRMDGLGTILGSGKLKCAPLSLTPCPPQWCVWEPTAESGNLSLIAASVVLPAIDLSFHFCPNYFSWHYLHPPSDMATVWHKCPGSPGKLGQMGSSAGPFPLAGNEKAAGSSQEAQGTQLHIGPTNANMM